MIIKKTAEIQPSKPEGGTPTDVVIIKILPLSFNLLPFRKK